MTLRHRPLLFGILLVGLIVLLVGATAAAQVVIAHRGASGYLPEHTLAAYAYAHAQGADFLEPDLMMSRDGVLVAMHDRTLDATTNVAQVFPGRARPDGSYYVADFTLPELKLLTVRERGRAGVPVYPDRFPIELGLFTIPTLEEIILLTQGLNKSTGRTVGIYPETKSSEWHREQGLFMEEALLDLLAAYGYADADAPTWIQSFESSSLRRLRFELDAQLPLVQLIAASDSHLHMLTETGLDEIAAYANAIGPSKRLIEDVNGNPVQDLFLVRAAHERGLAVHPYTFRADSLPAYAADLEDELRRFFFDYGVDGVFVDFPDIAVELLEEEGYR